jgi:ligand-binding SRPBCC domain-containing protein
MQTIRIETKIAAPVERCFLLSLSMDLHTESAARTNEEAIAGVTHGIIGPGESVTFEGRHFGFKLRHTSIISGYDRPKYFQDSMTKGMFKSFEHDHFFAEENGGTMMRDELRFAAPLGVLGAAAEAMVLKKHLAGFLIERNALIKRVAESQAWRRFILDGSGGPGIGESNTGRVRGFLNGAGKVLGG